MLPRLVDPRSDIGVAERAVDSGIQQDSQWCIGSEDEDLDFDIFETDPKQRQYEENYPQENEQLVKIEEARAIVQGLRAAKTVLELA